MKIKEIRELSIKELHERIDAETSSLNQNRINHSISPLDNPSVIKEQRRSIARLNTELRQRELNDNKV
jgi:ribosomal protein L29